VTTGLVIGKFLPPHRGHLHLIATAAAAVDRLTVLLFSKAAEPIPGELRAAWMRELCPQAQVLHSAEEHPVDFGDPAVWALWIGAIRRVLPAGPDLVFSSEAYGDELARRLGARHVAVDRERRAVPVSATRIRAAPLANWEYLPPCVRPHYALRVAIVGAESTGKTTLARELAARRRTAWVPEFARAYLEIGRASCRERVS
jgi:NadR type nicotinamide-nucleotide adenylyltransferase